MATLAAPTDTTPPGLWTVGEVFIFDRADAETASRAMGEPMRRFRLPSPAPAPARPRVRSHRPRGRRPRRSPRRTRGPDTDDSDGHGDDVGRRGTDLAESAVPEGSSDVNTPRHPWSAGRRG
jgi:hypothetical protein